MQNENQRLKQIISIDSDLNKIQDLDILLQRILNEARKAVGADAGTIYIRNGDKLDFRYAQNETKQKLLPAGQKLIYSFFSVDINKNSVSGYAADTGEILNIADMYDIDRNAPYSFDPSYDKITQYKTIATLTFPLRTNTGEILGVLQLINPVDEKGEITSYSETDELFADHFAANAAIALQRAQMTRAILLRMNSMAELRDPTETGPHVNRVASYAVEIYDRWAYNHEVDSREREQTRDILRMVAMLHDVGKVAISDVILKKPGPFTPEERLIMQTHTYQGARLFNDNQSEFDGIAQEVALTHHEWWNGTGYPGYIDINEEDSEKLMNRIGKRPRKGEEIPLFGRIVAIADVFDALCSHRVYKNAWAFDDVLDEVKKNSGRQFDPELVDIFFDIMPQIKQVRERYPESG
ncbi:MAG: HD domain-containing protein [Spirochaetales bacterium]|jgi:HD-GYP domain-containing protein (c-di-GMP phosphodiesterase class II)|nr:HD domain-containing protein [Spirochaetales bacterium]